MARRRTVWRPVSRDQYRALSCRAYFVLIHGNRGGGKTDILLVDFLRDVGKGHGENWRGVLIRQTYPQLSELVRKSHTILKAAFPRARWNGSTYCWTFPGGERLYFRYLKSEKDYWNFHGQEFQWIGYDELTTWPDQTLIDKVASTLRSSASGVRCRIRAATNPAGVGHGWVKSGFIDRANPGSVFTGPDGLTRAHFFIGLDDNTHITQNSPEYIARLEAITDPNLRKAWRSGSWDIVAGGMFSDVFDRAFHVLDPFPVDEIATTFRAFDWGSSKPFSVGWWAELDIDHKHNGRILKRGSLIRIAEWYGWNGTPNQGVRMTSTEIARGVLTREKDIGTYVVPGPADSAIYTVTDGESIADKMATAGVTWTPSAKGPGSRVAGWQEIRTRLAASTKAPMEEPGLFVFSGCPQWIRTVPSLPRDGRNTDDVDTNAEDHAGDETRYAVTRNRVGATSVELPW